MARALSSSTPLRVRSQAPGCRFEAEVVEALVGAAASAMAAAAATATTSEEAAAASEAAAEAGLDEAEAAEASTRARTKDRRST